MRRERTADWLDFGRLLFVSDPLYKKFCSNHALLPAIVCVVIMMVNGNVGAGVAVAGAFSLVRFRSVSRFGKGNWRGFFGYGNGGWSLAWVMWICIPDCLTLGGVSALYNRFDFGSGKRAPCYKTLHITIPEDLDYPGVFDDLLKDYTTRYELVQVKTTNMGSLFRLTYQLTLRDGGKEKELIDKLRCRNGNLEISLSQQETGTGEL